MDSERWKRVRTLLEEALSVEPDQRDDHLRKAAGGDAELAREVRELLERQPRELEPPAPARLAAAAGRARLGLELGPYRLERVLGSGGMGTVYLARRRGEGFEQEVALKLLRRGLESPEALRRFHAERALLATLQHERIARFLDGGTTDDGQPWYAMELVDGEPIDTWCAGQGLDTRARVTLFLEVCEAVQHAHKNLVVHRDLKPANLLVTRDGRVKLLDFGVAKLLADERAPTAPGEGALTPAYASPEQLRGEPVTTAADVYALGVVLYELLCGARPFATPTLTLSDVPPQRASTRTDDPRRARALRGDLDTILAKALQADVARRYATVEALGEDLRRHLAGKTVSARPDTLAYRVRTFARRNRVALAFAVAALVALVAGLAATFAQYREARAQSQLRAQALEREAEQRARAEARFEDLHALSSELLFGLHDDIEFLPGATVAREHLVRTGLRYLEILGSEGDASLAPELAAGYLRIAEIQCDLNRPNLGRVEDALGSLSEAERWLSRALAGAPEDARSLALTARIGAHRGIVLLCSDRQAEAEQELGRVLAPLEELVAAVPGDSVLPATYLKVLMGCASAAGERGNLGEERRQLEQGLAFMARRAKSPNGHEEWAELTLRTSLLSVLEREDRQADALTTALELLRDLTSFSERFPTWLSARKGVAMLERQAAVLLMKAERTPEAIAHAERAVEIQNALSGLDPANQDAGADLVTALMTAGQTMHQSDRFAEALPYFRAARARLETVPSLVAELPATRAKMATALCHEGLSELAGGELESGREHSRTGLTLQQRLAEAEPASHEQRIALGSLRLNYGKTLWWCARRSPELREELLAESLEVLAQARLDFEGLAQRSPSPLYPRYLALADDLLAKVEAEL